MSRNKSKQVPTYRRQRRCKSADVAFVEIDKRRIYLGDYGSPESREMYCRLLAENEAGIASGVGLTNQITVAELVAAFWKHAVKYYRTPDGATSQELSNYKYILKHVVAIYGLTTCDKFGPRAIKTVRTRFIKAGWCRTNINRSLSRVKHVFKWGVENELVSPSVYHALQCVSGLTYGRTEARENPPKRPVPENEIEAVRSRVSRHVRALIDLQLLTASRPGELVKLRAIDIDMSHEVWVYRPTNHKTSHYGHSRVIYFGPKAQEVLQDFLADRPVDAYLFDPREAEAERYAKATSHRRPNQKQDSPKSSRTLGESYTTASYRRAIERACVAAKIPVWSPHRLRHSAATRLRGEVGLDLTQTILGHRLGSRVTEIYAESAQSKAADVMAAIG